MLAIGATIVEEIRKDIFDTLGYHCSAGISHSKVNLLFKFKNSIVKSLN